MNGSDWAGFLKIDYPHPESKNITKQEALKVIDRAEEEGLIHQSYNVASGHRFICNCCRCCSLLLRGALEFGARHMMLKSKYTARIDHETCIDCEVCTSTCPEESITMEHEPESECTEPAPNLGKWHLKRGAGRGTKLR